MIGTDDIGYAGWISDFKQIERLSEQLQFILVILYQLDSRGLALFETDIRRFEKIFKDIPFMRRVKHRDAMVSDYAVEYFGKDYGEDDPFLFDSRLEFQIQGISGDIMSCLGRVVKYLKESDLIIGDDI